MEYREIMVSKGMLEIQEMLVLKERQFLAQTARRENAVTKDLKDSKDRKDLGESKVSTGSKAS